MPFKLSCNLHFDTLSPTLCYFLTDTSTNSLLDYSKKELHFYKGTKQRPVDQVALEFDLITNPTIYLASCNFTKETLRRIPQSLFVDFTKIPFTNLFFSDHRFADQYTVTVEF